MYLRDGCRNPGSNAVRIGDHAYAFCDDPKHDPTKRRRRARAGSKR
jgi:hypothetical protein